MDDGRWNDNFRLIQNMLSTFFHRAIPRDQFQTRQFLLSALSFSSLSFSAWIDRSSSKSYCSPIHRNPNVKIPPRFGVFVPRHLLPKDKRSLTTIISKDDTTHMIDNISQSSSKRTDCPMCKKYSQGPCGDLFTSWLSCIDSNVGNEQKCDDYVQKLKSCLDNHNDYYEQIDAYGESKDENEDVSIERWKSFISDLEQDGSFRMFDKEEKQYQPDMQVRLQSKMGAAMFHPNIKDDILLLVYVKDQDGNILGAGSVDELFYWNETDALDDKEHDANDGRFILRFRVEDDTTQVTVYALYGTEEEENSTTANDCDKVLLIRWRKQQIKR